MLVFNAAGNNFMSAPADGDSVISVGAVTSTGELTRFSYLNRTADGRMKPDVVAMGSFVKSVNPNSVGAFTHVSGTSFSCPLVAGVAALILSAHPDLTPMQVRDALRETADRADNPELGYGWGIVNALDAILYHGLVFSNRPVITYPVENTVRISVMACSKYGIPEGNVFLHVKKYDGTFDALQMHPTDLNFEYTIDLKLTEYDTDFQFYFSATDSLGKDGQFPSNAPIELATLDGQSRYEPNIPKTFQLQDNTPNPFYDVTTIKYAVPYASLVTLYILDDSGERIRELVNEYQEANYIIRSQIQTKTSWC